MNSNGLPPISEPSATPQGQQQFKGHLSLVMWDEVPADQHHHGLHITYHSQTENDTRSVINGPNDRQMNLKSVQRYVNKNITVLASTAKGNVSAKDPVDH